MTDFIEKAYLAGLGVLSVTREKAKELVDELVEKGKITADEAPKFMKDLLSRADEGKKALEEHIEKGIENTIEKLGLATKKEIAALDQKLDQILKELRK
jgi:polyhydroxyalkanoate synthesis regulator phasin